MLTWFRSELRNSSGSFSWSMRPDTLLRLLSRVRRDMTRSARTNRRWRRGFTISSLSTRWTSSYCNHNYHQIAEVPGVALGIYWTLLKSPPQIFEIRKKIGLWHPQGSHKNASQFGLAVLIYIIYMSIYKHTYNIYEQGALLYTN